MFTFLGKGGAFDIQRGNTSAFYKSGTTMYLIDCGEDVFNKLMRYDVLDGVGKIFVFITHLHSDHVGSLGTLLQLLKVTDAANVKVIYPAKEKLQKLLSLMGYYNQEVVISPEEYNGINQPNTCEAVRQTHIDNEDFESFGYFFETDGKRVYFSGDCSKVNDLALKKLKAKQLDYFYHEASIDGYAVHTPLADLDALIPKRLRDSVYLMHINLVTENQAKKLAFNIVETIDDFDFEAEDGQSCLIIGPLTNAEKSQVNKYKKLAAFCKNHFKEVITPIETMKFGGSPTERYKRATRMIGDASIVIADVSEPSTGAGMELFRVKQVRKKAIIVAKKGANVSTFVKGLFGSEKILYYSSTVDLLRQLEVLFKIQENQKEKK